MRIDPKLALSALLLAAVGCVDDPTNPATTKPPVADASVSAPKDGGGGGGGDAGAAPVDAGSDTASAVDTCPMPKDATVTVLLHVTADNRRTVSVNGIVVEATENEWSSPTAVPITLFRHPSRLNVVAIEGRNLSSQGGLDRGILADIDLGAAVDDAGVGSDGGAWPLAAAHLVSDASWRISKTAPTGWTGLDFHDAAGDAGVFASAVAQGKNGVAPWGAITGFDANAQWIWTFDSSGTTAEKVDVESAYARREFYFDATGQLQSAPSTCP